MIGEVTVSGTAAQWYEVNITSYVQAQRAAGQTMIAIAIKNPTDTLPYSAFNSRESGRKPELVIQ